MTDNSLLEEAQDLQPNGVLDLFEIKLRNNTLFRFRNGPELTWQGMFFNQWPCKMSGDVRTAEEEEPRPTLVVANPEGAFTKVVFEGLVENAIVRRYQVLRRHADADLPISVDRMWRVGRIPQLIRGKSITLELKNLTEGPNFKLPVRIMQPPEFPFVSL
jgi:phage-related protein